MSRTSRHSQLQVRVSKAEKNAIRRAAERAGMDMSAYVLARVLPAATREFEHSVKALTGPAPPSFALAELNSLLSRLAADELRDAIAARPSVELSPFLANYVAAMVEAACARRAISVPAWTRAIAPLEEPVFGSALERLRLYLLTHSPAPFRRRNLFIDSSLGEQV
jgi:uncharacterized protein (DUF1778 family)